ncbi:MAG: restriction endonuclease subunit S [Bacteroides sp.]|nr:restriction endonuclease subunit S [Bacteroides sp.]
MSAIIDKVFCLPSEKQPNKRLDGFNGDWKIVTLSEICDRITDKNSDQKCNLVLTIAAQYGLVSQLDFFNKSVASENLSSYYVLKNGDFAYNKSYSGEYVWGAIKKLDSYEEGVLSPLYICFRPNQKINPDFLAFYFESKKWYRGISEIAGEGARNHGLLNISVIDFFNTIHRIPSLLEQLHIASLLQSYQNKINNEEKLLLYYQSQRKYLLTSMFI